MIPIQRINVVKRGIRRCDRASLRRGQKRVVKHSSLTSVCTRKSQHSVLLTCSVSTVRSSEQEMLTSSIWSEN